MDGSSVIFIVMPIVIPLVIFAGIALPYLADSRSGRKDRDMHTTFVARQGSGPVNARPQVVIVGAGFAGLKAARALRHADADVTIVDGHDYHTFQPLLYQVSTGYLAPEEVGAALHAILAGSPTYACASVRRPGWTTRAVHSCFRTVPRSASTT